MTETMTTPTSTSYPTAMTATTTPTMKRLYRSRTDRKIAGVLGGLGEYLNADPTVLRVLFVVLALLTGGATLLAYPIMWFLTPEAPAAATWSTTATPPVA